ncbi:MAG TPA: acetoacetate decarboxylase family protein [Actinomycetota bacterium]
MFPSVTIQGRQLTFPVEVRQASSWAASFLVPAARAQAMIAHTPLQVAQPVPGRALVTIPFVRYVDSDLDSYNEVGVTVLVREHDAADEPAWRHSLDVARSRVGVYVHHLPVDQAFTLEAGRALWGYPKVMASIDIRSSGGVTACELRIDDQDVLRLRVVDGGPIPIPARMPPTYTYLDGVLRRTLWESEGVQIRGRLGGATLWLGSHPIADELRALGLPKRALLSQTIEQLRARFHGAEVLR